jgi:hypothetical protein
LAAFDDLLVFSCQFLYGIVAAEAASAPDSAETDLVFNVFEAFSQSTFLHMSGVLERSMRYKCFGRSMK